MKKRVCETHNRIVGQIVKSIVMPPLDAGGDMTDVMVVLESVILGVVLTSTRLGGDERVLDTLVENVKTRLAEMRLSNIAAAGHA